MNDSVKVTGICISGLCFCVSLALGEPVIAKTFFGIFCAILGLPFVGKGIQKLAK